MKRKIAVTVTLTPFIVIGLASTANAAVRPTHLHGHSHTCSDTNPQYFLADDGLDVYTVPGTTYFTADLPGNGRWKDAYWITGNHDESSSICDKRTVKGTGGAKGSVLHPGRINGPVVTADLHETGHRARLGLDVFATVKPYRTPTQMEADPRTWEIMIEPGRRGAIYHKGFVGWHRVYIGGGGSNPNSFNVRGLNLTALIKSLHIPGYYLWNAIGAGGETPGGSFTVYSYHLHVRGEHPVLRHRRHKHSKVSWKPIKHPIVTPGRPPGRHPIPHRYGHRSGPIRR